MIYDILCIYIYIYMYIFIGCSLYDLGDPKSPKLMVMFYADGHLLIDTGPVYHGRTCE